MISLHVAPSRRVGPTARPWILGLVVSFALGLGLGIVGINGRTSAPAVTATPFAPARPLSTGQPPGGPPQGGPTVAAEPAPADTGPKTTFSDGTYLVGQDIEAGSYKSAGPAPGQTEPCSWMRLKTDSGANVIANDETKGATRFSAKKGEYVRIKGCHFSKA